MNTEKIKNWIKSDRKNLKTNIITAFAIGVVCIIVGNGFFQKPKPKIVQQAQAGQTPKTNTQQDYEEQTLEKRLEEIFSKIEGAGEVHVMVMNGDGRKLTIAEDIKKENTNTTETASGGDKREIQSASEEVKTVLLENSDGSKVPFILKEGKPKVEGVIIVAQGGGDVLVKDSLSRAAQALLNVPAHKVEVLKMK